MARQTTTGSGLFRRSPRNKTVTTTTKSKNPFTGSSTTKTTTTGNGHHENSHHRHHRTTANTAPVHHHRRKATLGDKIGGAMQRLKGSLTGRRGVKAAGTRRMHGTDGRGSHRY